MSTPSPTPTPRVYRGRSTAELIPTIQAELGPEAIVLARRSGLEGGIGGFFQRPFVEIEAEPGGARVDLYDGGDATPSSFETTRQPLDALEPSTQAQPLETIQTPVRAQSFDALEPPSQAEPLERAEAFSSLLAVASDQPLALNYAQPLPERAAAQLDAQAVTQREARTSTQLETRTTTQLDPQPATASLPAADELADMEAILASRVELDQKPRSQPAPTRSKVATAIAAELQAIGFDERFAEDLIAEASAHVIPFAARIGLRRAVRIALERRIPVAAPLPGRGAALALVGPGGSGKTKCVAGLAAAYRQAGPLPVGCASISADASGESLRMVFSPRITTPAQARSQRALKAVAAARTDGLVLLDTPSLSPSQGAEIKELGRVLAEIAPDRTVAMVPATLGAKAATQLLGALAPVKPSAVAITHADETDQIGVAVQAACAFGLAPEYMLTGARGTRSITRLDPATLAQRLLP